MRAWTSRFRFFAAALLLCAAGGSAVALGAPCACGAAHASVPQTAGQGVEQLQGSVGYRVAAKNLAAYSCNGHQSLSGPAKKASKRLAAKKRADRPVEAYLELPGMGTMVLSVQPDGRATLRHVPPHMNASNFAVQPAQVNLRKI